MRDDQMPPLPSVPFCHVGDVHGPCASMTGQTEQSPLYTAEQMREYARAAVLAERGACAKVCDEVHDVCLAIYRKNLKTDKYIEGHADGASECADRIRARGDTNA